MTDKKDISAVIGISIRKALEFKNATPFTDEEWKIFWEQLSSNEEFFVACKSLIKNNWYNIN